MAVECPDFFSSSFTISDLGLVSHVGF